MATNFPKYEPICLNCGHGPGVHSPGNCAHIYRTLDREAEAVCICPGWKRDPDWPPPLVVQSK